MSSGSWPALVADIGGTNARFAMVDGRGALAHDVEVLATVEHPTLEDAIEAYLAQKGGQRPRAGCLAVAGPVTGDLIKFTNHPWEFSINDTRDALGLARLSVINDFEALALAVPRLTDDELQPIGGGEPVDGCPKAVLGPGTGLGVAAVVPTTAGWEALAGEGGHAELAVPDARLTGAIAILRREHDRLSAEQVLSGRGFEALHRALAELDGVPCAVDDAPEITDCSASGRDPRPRHRAGLFGYAGELRRRRGADVRRARRRLSGRRHRPTPPSASRPAAVPCVLRPQGPAPLLSRRHTGPRDLRRDAYLQGLRREARAARSSRVSGRRVGPWPWLDHKGRVSPLKLAGLLFLLAPGVPARLRDAHAQSRAAPPRRAQP